MKKYYILALALLSNLAIAEHIHTHAPIGVMGDHTHPTGEIMTSYRYMHMYMDGNRNGTHHTSNADILKKYMVTPEKMEMDMHMLGFMIAPSDQITLALMIPWLETSMDHVTRMGKKFTTETSGIGDITTSALLPLGAYKNWNLHLNLGLSIPTGSIDEQDDTPAGRSVLPYPMQLGSGTWDIKPGFTAQAHIHPLSYGLQAQATLRMGENDRDYTLGDKYESTAWIEAMLTPAINLSARIAYQHTGNISGTDSTLNPMMVPTADPSLRGGDRIDALIGASITGQKGILADHELALEIGAPLYQDLNGPQLETDLQLILGWKKTW